MNDALRAEWTKLRTLTSTAWLLIGFVGVTIGGSVIVAAFLHVNTESTADPTKLSLTGVLISQSVLAVFAILVVSEEYGTGMIRTTLSAVPHRITLLGAKATTVAGVTLIAALLGVTGCIVAGHFMLPGDGLNPANGYARISISQNPTLQAAIGSVIYLVLVALISLGVATAIRDTAASIGAVLGLLYLPPLLAQALGNPLRHFLEQIAPMTAGLSIQATTNLRSLPIAPWAGLGVLAVWAVGAIFIGGLLFRQRDA